MGSACSSESDLILSRIRTVASAKAFATFAPSVPWLGQSGLTQLVTLPADKTTAVKIEVLKSVSPPVLGAESHDFH